MTSSRKTAAHILLATGGDQVTVYASSIKESYAKKLILIQPGQSTANRDLGPKKTKQLDLLRLTLVFTVNGYISSAQRTRLRDLMKAGGTFNMNYDSEDFDVNFTKLDIDNNPSKTGEQDEYDVMFSVTEGEDV